MGWSKPVTVVSEKGGGGKPQGTQAQDREGLGVPLGLPGGPGLADLRTRPRVDGPREAGGLGGHQQGLREQVGVQVAAQRGPQDVLGALDPELVIDPEAGAPHGGVNIFLKVTADRLVEVLEEA